MIEKLEKRQVPIPGNPAVVKWMGMDNESLFDKINELVDVVNEFQKILHDVVNESVKNMSWVDTLQNIVLELRAKVKEIDNEPAENGKCAKNAQDPYNEQRWVGCLCKLWTGDGLVRYGILRGVALNRKKTNYPYQVLSTSFEHCEPVKPDDDIIYKGGDNE